MTSNFKSLDKPSLGLRLAFAIFFLAVLHRTMASQYLHTSDATSLGNLYLEGIVGILGDIWVSFLLSAPFFIAEIIGRNSRALRWSGVLWLGIWTVFTAAHQGYVEYFRQQVIPFHLGYIFDRAFLEANNQTLVASRSSVILACGALFIFMLARSRNRPLTRNVIGWQFTVFAIIAVLAHVENIKWRVQWYVPEALQTHYLERLFTNFKTKHAPEKLSAGEMKLLASKTGSASHTPLQTLLGINKTRIPVSPDLDKIKTRIAKIQSSGASPIVALIVAESLRPADVGWTRSAEDPPSITPELDALVAKGIHFENAYSTGPVTRGGQEAAWCGVPTATDTSLMRSYPLFKLSCIGDRAKTNGASSQVFWMHGGNSRFDSQMEFWSHHHVDHFLTQSDFPTSTPHTGWGISDLALFTKGADVLTETAARNPGTGLFPMILSVTNHIPWDLPADAADQIKALSVEHESHRTTAYFDDALAAFTTQLKKSNVWQNTVLIIVSDHGGLEVVRNHSYKRGNPLKWEHLASHINLIFSGGITESLVAQGDLPRTTETFVSQAQIAPTIASISGLDPNDFMDIPLFAGPSPWPVASDLNQYLLLPADNLRIAKEDVFSTDVAALPENSRIAVLRYRAFLQMLYEFKP